MSYVLNSYLLTYLPALSIVVSGIQVSHASLKVLESTWIFFS